MTGFTLLKRGCPICDGAKTDCRQSNQSGLIFCRESSANPIGFIFRGLDKWGFGLWQPSEDAEAFSQKSREEWQRERRQRQLESERQRQQQIAGQLPALERHRYYSKILDQLPLREIDQADLQRRGFSSEQVEADSYRSVEQRQEVLGAFPPNLPGALNNRKLNSLPGCIFPVRDVDGLITALAIRLRDGSNGRYRWLTSATKKNPDGATPHLNTELPLAVFEPEEYSGNAIWLVEGVGIKPSLTRYRLGVPVVGASSGLFNGSPNICKLTLEKLSTKYQTQSLVIAVDAGDVKNGHVCQRWQSQFEFLRSLGYSLQVGWWDQLDKTDLDIDELPPEHPIELLSIEEFEAICREQGGLTETGKADSTSTNESGICFRRVRTSLDELMSSFPNLNSEAGKEWLKLRQFTPDETINSEYFYSEPPKEGEGLAVLSGLGTGKSFYTNEHYISEDDGAIFLGNRNTVIEQFVENAKERHNLTWYLIQQDLKEGGRENLRLIQDPQSKIISCIDSILYIQPQDAVDKKNVFDEVESTLKHLNYSTTAVSYRRQLCKQRLAEIISESHSLLLCDGNLKDITVNYIEKLSDKKIKKVKNLYKGNRGKVTYYIGSQKFQKNQETNKWESVEQRLNDYSLLLKTMMEDCAPFITGADSQEQLEVWERQLKAKARKTFRLDGTTSNTPEGKKFIRNPARYIQENNIDVVLYSPSGDQGLSIDLKGYFKRGYFFFFGVVLTDTQIQFLGRLRDAGCHLHVYCQVKHKDANTANSGLLSDGIQEFFLEYARDCATLSLSDIDDENRTQKLTELAYKLIEKSNDIHYQYECQLLAMAYFEQNNLRNCLEYAMREAGWQVEVVTGSKASTSELDEIKEVIRTERSEKILTAAPFTEPSEAQKIERSGVRSEECKVRLLRHKLLGRLPGIENKFITEKKIVRVPASELTTGKSTLNQVSIEAQTQQQQGLEAVHIPPVESISHEAGCGHSEVEQEVSRPVFDADFIKLVKFEDRGLISRLEGQVLLRNPHIAKLAQLKKWQKKLSLFQDENEVDGVKRINLTTYKSPWLKIHTLLEMGISHFIQPESRWTQESPEAIAFWERARDSKLAQRIGMQVGDSDVCQYIGRVLDSYGIKRESQKITLPNGERVREYRLKALDSICQAIYDCVEAKILTLTGEQETVLDWTEILEKAPSTEAQSQEQQGLEAVHIAPTKSINHEAGCGQTEAEDLALALSFCDLPSEFAAVIEGFQPEIVEAAIVLQNSQPRRQQLYRWYDQGRLGVGEEDQVIASDRNQIANIGSESLANSAERVAEVVEAEPQVGSRVWAWIASFRRWGQGVVEHVVPKVLWRVCLDSGEGLASVTIYRRDGLQLAEPSVSIT